MTGIEASKLANEYLSGATSSLRALEILQILRENGWKTLANNIEKDK